MQEQIRALEQEREKLVRDIRAELAKHEGEIPDDAQERINAMRARHTEAGEEAETLRRKMRERTDIEDFLTRASDATATQPGNGGVPAGQRAEDTGALDPAHLDYRTMSGNDAQVRTWLSERELQFENERHAQRALAMSPANRDLLTYLQAPSQARAIVMGTDAQGGYLVAPNTDLYGMLTEQLAAYEGVYPLMSMIEADTLAEAPKPRSAENIRRATVIGEGEDGADRTTPVFAQDKFIPRTIATDRYGATWQAIRSAGINLTAYIAKILGEQMARGMHYYLINGNKGAAKPEPQGLNTAGLAVVAGLSVGYKIGATQLHVGAYDANSKDHGLRKLLPAVQHGVNIAYRRNAKSGIVMSDAILMQLRTAVASTGQALYPELDMPTIDGTRMWGGMRLVVDPNMPGFAANGASANMLYVGDFGRFWCLNVSGFIFIDDPYTGSLSLTHRYRLAKAFDSEVIDPVAMARVAVTSVT